MPTYEYECTECGYTFEVFQKVDDEPVEECPSCHSKKVRRLISGGAGLIFKGSGFYITDYKKNHSSTGTGKTHKKEEKSSQNDTSKSS